MSPTSSTRLESDTAACIPDNGAATSPATEKSIAVTTGAETGFSFWSAWHKASCWWGMALLIFAVAVVMTGIVTRVNNPPWKVDDSHAVLEVVLFWAMLGWIAMLEGCQISIVGLQKHDPEKFKVSHPRAYRSCKLVCSGANVERFLVGRQFLLLFNGFLASRIGGGQNLEHFMMGEWEWTSFATQFFFSNGVMLMIVIVALGQLPTQLVAAERMLGFLNLPLGHHYLVVLPCLAVECIGLTHSSYLLKNLLCLISGIDQSVADPSKKMKTGLLFYAKCALSCAAVVFSATFIIKGLVLSQTNATEGPGWDRLPGAAAVVVSLCFLFMLACAEGLQVSIIALANVPAETYREKSPLAYRTCQLAYKGRNMHAFLVGRQFLTAMNMVLLARVTSYAGSGGVLLPGGDWGMGRVFNEWLLQTGFLGAILVVNVGQLASQVTASIFPVAVINNHFMNWALRLMLLIEFVGIVNACWPLAWLMSKAFMMAPDPTLDAVASLKQPSASSATGAAASDKTSATGIEAV